MTTSSLKIWKVHPDAILAELRSRSPADEDHAFALTTDGSGQDGICIGTGSTFVLRPVALTHDSWRDAYKGSIGMTHGGVKRAEMLALIEGLRCAQILLGLVSLRNIELFTGRKIPDISFFPPEKRYKIQWMSDRQELVFQMARDRKGIPYYERRVELDLWRQLEFFEFMFDITCVFHPRNTTADAAECDAVSGKVRRFMKTQYHTLNP